jgi:hypothetical protein
MVGALRVLVLVLSLLALPSGLLIIFVGPHYSCYKTHCMWCSAEHVLIRIRRCITATTIEDTIIAVVPRQIWISSIPPPTRIFCPPFIIAYLSRHVTFGHVTRSRYPSMTHTWPMVEQYDPCLAHAWPIYYDQPCGQTSVRWIMHQNGVNFSLIWPPV